VRIEKYQLEYKDKWDKFLEKSKIDTFLLKRDYIEYHSDRFEDCSLIIFDENNNIIALLPANKVNNILYTHQGLTYGGIIVDFNSKTQNCIEYFNLINSFLLKEGIEKVIYKKPPYIYSNLPNDEDEYCLFRLGASNISCGISSTIKLDTNYKFNKSRKSCVSKAKRFNLDLEENQDFSAFWRILEENLKLTHNAKPVHNLEEIEYLKSKFPQNIRLFSAYEEKNCVAGVIVYENKRIVHIQYISANERGKEISALDFIFDKLIKEIYKNKEYFDFGVSTEDGGRYLNEGLIFQKEGFGGRGVCYKVYEYEIKRSIIIE